MTRFLSRLFSAQQAAPAIAAPAPEPAATAAAVPALPPPPPGGTQFPPAMLEAFAAFQAAASLGEATLERRRAMYNALKHLREAEALLRVTLHQVPVQGRAATASHWAPQLQGLMAEMAAVQTRMAAELKGRKSRLQGLLHVTRERTQDVRGYYPARGRQIRLDTVQARHCVQFTA
ncbi:hypothetical protein [Nitrospirillum iridis]|uniref:Uncharacterized protein n=1 Tax=Nitrospirillum iridis TaxID=765888 RepID=A0A7X0EE12_9PROT|nr:hypothetical protein [Nitrospirillum iridis]MBB6251551.1 hypothetical protein [Nitrospirillum iridis]